MQLEMVGSIHTASDNALAFLTVHHRLIPRSAELGFAETPPAPVDQPLHLPHNSVHHERPPYRQSRPPRKARCHRPPHPAKRLRRGRQRQDQALSSSPASGMHHHRPCVIANVPVNPCTLEKQGLTIGFQSIYKSQDVYVPQIPTDTAKRLRDY